MELLDFELHDGTVHACLAPNQIPSAGTVLDTRIL
jgi:hypothetical protein